MHEDCSCPSCESVVILKAILHRLSALETALRKTDRYIPAKPAPVPLLASNGKPQRETLTIAEFAKRVHRSRKTAYDWIAKGRMPSGTVLMVQGHYEIDWTLYSKKSIVAIPSVGTNQSNNKPQDGP